MEVAASGFPRIRVDEEIVEQHAEEVAGEDGADEGLVPGWVERGCFRGEEYQLDNGTDGEEDDRATVVMIERETVSGNPELRTWEMKSGVAECGGMGLGV